MDEEKESQDTPTDWKGIAELVEKAPPAISEAMQRYVEIQKEKTKQAELGIDAINRLNRFLFCSVISIILFAGTVSIISLVLGKPDVAERIIIPLISFAGGLGVGSYRPFSRKE